MTRERACGVRSVADWKLAFARTEPVELAACERLIGKVASASVVVERGEPNGNPRDGYSRDTTLRAGSVALHLRQELRGLDEPEPKSWIGSATLSGHATFAEKRAAWEALHSGLGALGCTDRTVEYGWPGPIIDDADAAGEHAYAQALSDALTAALIARVQSSAEKSIVSAARAPSSEGVVE